MDCSCPSVWGCLVNMIFRQYRTAMSTPVCQARVWKSAERTMFTSCEQESRYSGGGVNQVFSNYVRGRWFAKVPRQFLHLNVVTDLVYGMYDTGFGSGWIYDSSFCRWEFLWILFQTLNMEKNKVLELKIILCPFPIKKTGVFYYMLCLYRGIFSQSFWAGECCLLSCGFWLYGFSFYCCSLFWRMMEINTFR